MRIRKKQTYRPLTYVKDQIGIYKNMFLELIINLKNVTLLLTTEEARNILKRYGFEKCKHQ